MSEFKVVRAVSTAPCSPAPTSCPPGQVAVIGPRYGSSFGLSADGRLVMLVRSRFEGAFPTPSASVETDGERAAVKCSCGATYPLQMPGTSRCPGCGCQMKAEEIGSEEERT